MGSLKKYFKMIYRYSTKTFFDRDYISQKIIIDSFSEPKNLIERSLFQYKCQMLSLPLILRLLQNFTSIFLLPIIFIQNYRVKNKNKNKPSNFAIFLREGVTIDIIPDSLQNEFKDIIECSLHPKGLLLSSEVKFIFKNLLKYWYHPFFCLKCISKLSLYSHYIHEFNPKSVIVHCEYSFTSSLLTAYCHNSICCFNNFLGRVKFL